MEAALSHMSGEEIDPFGQAPPEVLVEIENDLTEISQEDAEPEFELGPEIRLTSAQTQLAILRYFIQSSTEDGWYRRVGQASEDKVGILNPLSSDLGMGHTTLRSAIMTYANIGLLDVEMKVDNSGLEVIADVFRLPAALEVWEGLQASQPEEIAAAESYLMRRKRETILFVYQEINNEEIELGLDIKDMTSFKDLSSFQTLQDLDEYLQSLHLTQRKHLSTLDDDFEENPKN